MANEEKTIEALLGHIEETYNTLVALDNKIYAAAQEIRRNSKEVMWADVFHDTIIESKWLKYKNFSFGRSAIGYNFAYVLYRVLDETHPKSILELGLGQSTHMVMQYNSFMQADHICVEQNEKWLEFWNRNNKVSKYSNILLMPVISKAYKDDNVLVYDGFEKFKEKKFDLFIIDAPLQPDTIKYRRIDILSIIPDSLDDNWVIIFDDCQRLPDQNAVKEVVNLLNYNKIEFHEGIYRGSKDVYVIVSKELQFLTTL